MINRRLFAAACAAALGSAVSAPLVPAFGMAAGLAIDIADVSLAQQKLAGHLIAALAAKAADQNVIVSPMSVAEALAIIAQGADVALQHSLRHTLRMLGKGDDLAVFAQILAATGKYDAASPLILANRLVLDPALQTDPALLARLRGYGVEAGMEDLADPASIAKINAWVKQQTRELIPSIIDEAPGAGSLVALNALYFKDKWLSQFDPALSAMQPFTGADGKSAAVMMMRQEGMLRLRREGDLIGVDLGFADPRFSLVVVTSLKKPQTAAVLARTAHDWLGGGKFAENAGSLMLPRLKIEGASDLLEPLRHLGLKDEANSLRGFGAKPPRITAISQRAVLKLDEEGAEAAAATAVLATRSISGGEIHMVVDKPFLFGLRDISNGMLVVSGYVGRPGEAA